MQGACTTLYLKVFSSTPADAVCVNLSSIGVDRSVCGGQIMKVCVCVRARVCLIVCA